MNREEFKMLDNNIIYFDNGATTFKPNIVVDSMNNYYNGYCSNAHRGDYEISSIASLEYEKVREIIKDFINAREGSEIFFTSGATDGLNKVIFGYFKKILKKGDVVLTTKSEHASLLLPLFKLKEDVGIEIEYIDLDECHEVTIKNVEKAISDRTKLIALSYITNVIGDVRPIREICSIAHKNGIEVLVDGAQAVSHVKLDMQADDIDFFCASAHKFYGPTGVGFVYGKFNKLDLMDPTTYGGGMNAMFLSDGYMELREVPTRFEAGTQNIAGVIGMGCAISYLSNIGIDKIHEYECNLKEYMIKRLSEFDNVVIYNRNNRGSIVTFNIKDIFSQDVSIYLNKYNICIRSGNHCAKIIDSVFSVSNTCRVSFALYNTYEDIDKFIDVLENISNIWNEIL